MFQVFLALLIGFWYVYIICNNTIPLIIFYFLFHNPFQAYLSYPLCPFFSIITTPPYDVSEVLTLYLLLPLTQAHENSALHVCNPDRWNHMQMHRFPRAQDGSAFLQEAFASTFSSTYLGKEIFLPSLHRQPFPDLQWDVFLTHFFMKV